jgi:hypothetical protein
MCIRVAYRDKDLKRATLVLYETIFERLYRDLGADTSVRDFADGRLRAYFDDFKSYKVIGEKTAKRAHTEGKDVRQIEVERWSAQSPGSQAVEVATKAEAALVADELPCNWEHVRRGTYRVIPLNAQRAKTVTYARAKVLETEGWTVT